MSLPLHRDRSFVLSGCYTPTYSPRRSSPEHPRALAVGRSGGGEQGEGEEAGHSSESHHRPVPPPRESGYALRSRSERETHRLPTPRVALFGFGLDARASSRPLASPAMRAMPAGAWPPSNPSLPELVRDIA